VKSSLIFAVFGAALTTGSPKESDGEFERSWHVPRLRRRFRDAWIEMRKTMTFAGRPGGGHVFVVDRRPARHRLQESPTAIVAQDEDAALLATELALKGQKKRPDRRA